MRTEISTLSSEVARLRGEIVALRQALAGPALEQRLLPFAPQLMEPEEQLVTLDQMTAIVRLRRRSLEHYRDQLPEPRINGKRGQAARWAWSEVRPWLAEHYPHVVLPERYPVLPAG